MRTISSTTRNNLKKLKTWMKNLIIFLLYESDDSQESFSFIAELSREKRTTPSEYLQEDKEKAGERVGRIRQPSWCHLRDWWCLYET